VLVPTHDHGPTLEFAIASALDQTVEDLRILVIGDGVPADARELITALCAEDDRITFLDHPKGARHGEAYRHEALRDVTGPVLYLSDDDLWLPHHVETVLGALDDGADWAHTFPVWVLPDGELGLHALDLADGHYREQVSELTHPRVPGLSQTGHTIELYRALPRGWHPAPPGIPTDVHMWRQILELPWVRPRSIPAVTALSLPSPARPGWSAQERAEELGAWYRRLAGPQGRQDFERAVIAKLTQRAAWEEKHAELREAALSARLEAARPPAALRRALRRLRPQPSGSDQS
jgi:hypothetical protein